MLARFSVKNYRNFCDRVTLDLASPRDYTFNSEYVRDGVITNALIIGPNASGKTNLVRAIADVRSNYYAADTPSYFVGNDALFVNADSLSQEAEFEYVFRIKDHVVAYAYAKGPDRLIKRESLLLDGNIVFEYCNPEGIIKENLQLIGAESLNWKFAGDYSSVLAYLSSNVPLASASILEDLRRETTQIIMLTHELRSSTSASSYLEEVIRASRVDDLEVFLAKFGIRERLVVREEADGGKAVYCMHKRLIPFARCMSSGTFTLLAIFCAYEMRPQGTIYLLDEFDAYCHFELAERLMRYFGTASERQTITTTHNTSLTRNSIMRPDCIFKFTSGGDLQSLSELTDRELRLGNNVEKLLRNGEFD